MKFKVIILLITSLFAILSFNKNNDIKPAMILHQMYDSIKNIRTMHIRVMSVERTDGTFTTAGAEIKLQTHPRKIYFYNKDKKVEVLYDEEISKYSALVKVHNFPYLTLHLDPTGNLMRKNQHYTINDLGYAFIGKSIALTISKDKEGLNNFTYHGKHLKNGFNCYMLEYISKTYAYTSYTVLNKETASSIAAKICVNDYLLRNKNDLLNDFGYLKRGRVLKVPTLYCKRAILYIDDKLMLPISISLFDDAGLFEAYEYSSIQINKAFKPEEFSKTFEDYGF